jgi:ERF superfamily
MNIYQRINAVMKEVKYVQKEDKKVNGQYRFVSHDQVAAALHDPMATNGIVMIPSIAELTQDGNRTVVKMDIAFVNMDKPEDRFSIIQYGYGIDQQDKGVGKAVSYAVKYALLKQFCLETGDDVEKSDIPYTPPGLVKEDIEKKKRKLLENFEKEEWEKVGTYLKFIAEKQKKSLDDIVYRIDDADSFCESYFAWKKTSEKKIESIA